MNKSKKILEPARDVLASPDYREFIAALKSRVLNARISAARIDALRGGSKSATACCGKSGQTSSFQPTPYPDSNSAAACRRNPLGSEPADHQQNERSRRPPLVLRATAPRRPVLTIVNPSTRLFPSSLRVASAKGRGAVAARRGPCFFP